MPAPSEHPPRCVPLGDAALVVELASAIGAEATRRVLAACARLESAALPGVLEVVPAYTTVTLLYDLPALCAAGAPAADATGWLRERALAALADVDGAEVAARAPRTVELPVLYGGDAGPDLAFVARHTGLDAEEVVRRHAAATYQVALIGFTPGFPYLLGLPPELATPRLGAPRAAVPAGSVGIAGAQAGVYPLASPGGWRLVGRTPLALFAPDEDPPARLAPGDRVRFRAVGAAEYEALARRAAAPTGVADA